MINCAHPTHFASVVGGAGEWLERIRGLRANASRMSHAELDAATELDDGDPDDLAAHYSVLVEQLPSLNVLGGCCGTDHRHVRSICSAVAGDQPSTPDLGDEAASPVTFGLCRLHPPIAFGSSRLTEGGSAG